MSFALPGLDKTKWASYTAEKDNEA